MILRCPLLGWVTVDSATFEARSDSPQEGLRRDDGHKTGGEPRRSVEHGSPVETVSGGMWSGHMAPGKQKCSRTLVGGKMTRPGGNESFENSAKAEVGETMPGDDDRSCLNRLTDQRLRKSTQTQAVRGRAVTRPIETSWRSRRRWTKMCEAAPSRGQLKQNICNIPRIHKRTSCEAAPSRGQLKQGLNLSRAKASRVRGRAVTRPIETETAPDDKGNKRILCEAAPSRGQLKRLIRLAADHIGHVRGRAVTRPIETSPPVDNV